MKKRGLSVLLLFCMLLTMVPTVAVAAEEGPAPDIPTGAIYVSQDGVADGDGQSAQSALKFDEAMANAKDGNVFVVVGTVEMEDAGERYYDLRRERERCIKICRVLWQRKCLAFVTGRSHS